MQPSCNISSIHEVTHGTRNLIIDEIVTEMTELTQTHKHIVYLSSIAIVYGFWISLSFTRLLEQDWHDIANDILHVKQLLSQVAEPTHTSDILYSPVDVGAVMSSSDDYAGRGVTRPVVEYRPSSPLLALSLFYSAFSSDSECLVTALLHFIAVIVGCRDSVAETVLRSRSVVGRLRLFKIEALHYIFL